MGPGVLADIARDLVRSLRRDVATDWVSRDDVRAQLRSTIKRLLARYGYRPTPSPSPPSSCCARWKPSPKSGHRTSTGSCVTATRVLPAHAAGNRYVSPLRAPSQ
jgi:hypothetical protein